MKTINYFLMCVRNAADGVWMWTEYMRFFLGLRIKSCNRAWCGMVRPPYLNSPRFAPKMYRSDSANANTCATVKNGNTFNRSVLRRLLILTFNRIRYCVMDGLFLNASVSASESSSLVWYSFSEESSSDEERSCNCSMALAASSCPNRCNVSAA